MLLCYNYSMNEVKNVFLSLLRGIVSLLSHIKHYLKKFCRNFWRSFTSWIDPKLEKYRTQRSKKRAPRSENLTPEKTADLTGAENPPKNHAPGPENLTPASAKLTPASEKHAAPARNLASTTTQRSSVIAEPDSACQNYTPTSIEDFLALLKRTPRSVISQRERHVIATIMNFPNTLVSELMLPPSAITYVKDDEVLGPLTLDRLYRSGFQHFPVIDASCRIIGLIHTTALNSLEIKQTSRAREILDPKVYYLREDYTLNQALAAFLRTNCYFFLVIDRFERIVGLLTYEMIVDYLLGETPTDNFDRDSDRLAVAKRRLN